MLFDGGMPGIFPVTGFHLPPVDMKLDIRTRETYFPSCWSKCNTHGTECDISAYNNL